ncbi:hypothetical protein GCM10007862_07210 [Dyella lipolytica]|uniref:HGGxSTG domain-containing protein n=1 Tax=Dyella lipolytica TaxID=1867835 RepID=UPI00235D1318|nr:hypothetical protein GCM10007862_07210 [Dyella lipolytica]
MTRKQARELPDPRYWKILRKKPNSGPGETKRGIPADYAGDDPRLCNARTKSGRPCRALGLANGRCKWHGGMSTGPKTAEGKAAVTQNFRERRKLKNWVATELERMGRLPNRPTSHTRLRARMS